MRAQRTNLFGASRSVPFESVIALLLISVAGGKGCGLGSCGAGMMEVKMSSPRWRILEGQYRSWYCCNCINTFYGFSFAFSFSLNQSFSALKSSLKGWILRSKLGVALGWSITSFQTHLNPYTGSLDFISQTSGGNRVSSVSQHWGNCYRGNFGNLY